MSRSVPVDDLVEADAFRVRVERRPDRLGDLGAGLLESVVSSASASCAWRTLAQNPTPTSRPLSRSRSVIDPR
jgi:hypothetical protein